ncbi:hypothetical protein Pan181_44210 [Aeoliella mucimassa]|uniref:Uncharacterized protein n=1 Tax=Aeoliella mucimassa TaxID=2527972 RepID=A0A518ATY4_9BACT|nr:hypothetical protein Pan181_44210 [Aeoliella mucimassa]
MPTATQKKETRLLPVTNEVLAILERVLKFTFPRWPVFST